MPSRKCSFRPCGKRVAKEDAIVRGPQAWCSEDCMISYAVAAGRKLLEDRWKQTVKRMKANDLPKQKKLTQQVFNRMICLLDKTEGCISCDKPATWQGQWHASHFRSVGAQGALRFDARNVMKACSVCNNHLSGNLRGYREGILRRYDQALLDYLERDHEPVKLSCEQLIEMRKEFSAEVRRLERGEQPSRDWRKLPD